MNSFEWYDQQLAEYKEDGRKDADKGLYRPPYPGTDDPTDEDLNDIYKAGFMERRWELGDKFEWR